METARYILPLELTEAARAAEVEIRKSIEHVSGGYLVHRQVAVVHIEKDGLRFELTANELIAFFSYLRPLTVDSAEPMKRPSPEPNLSSRAGQSKVLKNSHQHFLRFAMRFFPASPQFNKLPTRQSFFARADENGQLYFS